MRCLVIGLCGVLAAAPAAAAGSCLEVVEQLSEQLGIDTTLPAPGEQATSMTDKLKASGGVLQPPDIGAPVAVQPPAQADRMPTTPPIEPQTSEGVPSEGGSGAARKVQLQSLLTAARSAGQRGDDAECTARLEEAQQLAAARD